MEREKVILSRLKDVIVNLDIEGVKKACREALNAGIPAYKCLSEGLAKGLDVVGEKYEKGEYFLADLVVAGEAMKKAMKILEPHLRTGGAEYLGRVVIGTVKGDMHDIGKNIVVTMLSSAGFEVIDLGVDVPPEKFVEAVRKYKPKIVGMSALLTTTMLEMENVIRFLRDAGLRDKVKVIVGGAPVSREYAEKIGADAYARDAVEGVAICKSWVSGDQA